MAKDAVGGRGGIRTHEGAEPPAGFQDRCLKPLGHPSVLVFKWLFATRRRTNVNVATHLPPDQANNEATASSIALLLLSSRARNRCAYALAALFVPTDVEF
jgi:hypothetical protein